MRKLLILLTVFVSACGCPNTVLSPEGKALRVTWEQAVHEYRYVPDQADEWRASPEGDCEDFVLHFYYRVLDPAKYNALFLALSYEERVTLGSLVLAKIPHHHAAIALRSGGELYLLDNGLIGFHGPFAEVSEVPGVVISALEMRKDRLLFAEDVFALKRVSQKVLPAVLPGGGVSQLREEFYAADVLSPLWVASSDP